MSAELEPAVYDNEKDTFNAVVEPKDEEVTGQSAEVTHRGLQQRQLSMIALGGSIGVGLVIGSGTSLARSGPASTFLAYLVIGFDCYAVLIALAEMSTQFPSRKGFTGHATRFVDPALGFATSVTYLCNYLVTLASQIVAGSLIMGYWAPNVNSGAWTPLLMVFALMVNSLPVKFFGEIEFWLSLLKALTLTGLIFLCFLIDVGAVPGTPRLGFVHWKNGDAFIPFIKEGNVGKFLGFVNALSLALFAYTGTELIGVTVGEAKNPRKTFPKAIKATFFRIAFFYIFGVLMVGLCVDPRSQRLAQAIAVGKAGGASASPFVVAIEVAGIKFLPGFINGCILLFTFSSSSSDLYISTRTVYALAMDGYAPKIFTYCTKRGVPIVSFGFAACFMLLSLLVISNSALEIFNYLSSAVTLCAGLAWISILWSHIAFMRGMKAQGVSRKTLPYHSLFQPYMSYCALVITSLVCIFKSVDAFMPFDTTNFVTGYIAFPVYFIAYFAYKHVKKTKIVKFSEMEVIPDDIEFADAQVEGEGSDLTWKDKISKLFTTRASTV